MKKYYVWSLALQLAHVIGGKIVPSLLALAAPLGVGIPLVVGAWYGASGPGAAAAAKNGFLIGVVPAFIGLVVAYLFGNVEAFLLVAGSLSSGVTGLLGGVLGNALLGKKASAG